MELNHTVQDLAESLGADLVGFADLAPAREFILDQGGEALAGFPRAIAVGVALLHPVVDRLPDLQHRGPLQNYRIHAYDLVNRRLDQVTSRVGTVLQRAGYRAYPVPASMTTDHERLQSIFSNKLAAHLAGLGWIGRSCMLITPQAGPRVRWATVLTDAPLEVGVPMDPPRCGDCRACVDACPAHAFTGRLFYANEPRSVRFDAHACKAYHAEREKELGISVCGLCLYACPYGQAAAAALS